MRYVDEIWPFGPAPTHPTLLKVNASSKREVFRMPHFQGALVEFWLLAPTLQSYCNLPAKSSRPRKLQFLLVFTESTYFNAARHPVSCKICHDGVTYTGFTLRLSHEFGNPTFKRIDCFARNTGFRLKSPVTPSTFKKPSPLLLPFRTGET